MYIFPAPKELLSSALKAAGAVSILRYRLISIGIPMLKIKRSRDRLIFNMGISIPGEDGFNIETGPWFSPGGTMYIFPALKELLRAALKAAGGRLNIEMSSNFYIETGPWFSPGGTMYICPALKDLLRATLKASIESDLTMADIKIFHNLTHNFSNSNFSTYEPSQVSAEVNEFPSFFYGEYNRTYTSQVMCRNI